MHTIKIPQREAAIQMDFESTRFDPFFGKIQTKAQALAANKIHFILLVLFPILNSGVFLIKATKGGVVSEADLLLGVLSLLVSLGYFWHRRSLSIRIAGVTAGGGLFYYLIQGIVPFLTDKPHSVPGMLVTILAVAFFCWQCVRYFQAAKFQGP